MGIGYRDCGNGNLVQRLWLLRLGTETVVMGIGYRDCGNGNWVQRLW